MVELVFLGTGAADWIEPDESGAFRRFASLLVDGCMLFDCTLTAVRYMDELNVDKSVVTDVLITHSHEDHFEADALAEIANCGGLNVYIESSWAHRVNIPGAKVIPIRPGEAFRVNHCSILPLRANHKPNYLDETALHYLVQRDGLSWYYATDGAWLTTHEFHTLLKGGYHLDAWITDATIGDGYDGDARIFEHNSLPMLREMLKTLSATGIIKHGAPMILTHMARTLHPCQAELERTLAAPFIPAYDGMKIKLEIIQALSRSNK